MPSVPKLRIHLLGPLEVIVGDRPISVDTRKALAIVALVAAEGRPFARDELAAMFWPDADDEAARGALRRTLSALRSAVGPAGITIDRARVTVDPDTTWVDLLELERLAASDRDEDLEAAASLARGPFLAGFTVRDSPDFDDWQAARAVRVEHIVGDLLDRLAAARSEGGDPSGAIEAARRRVDLDPLDEPGQRRVMDLLARSGDRNGAIRQYRSLVALFDRELGVAPLRETTELYDSIREGRVEVDPPAVIRAPRAAAAPSRAEAVGEAPLIGRDPESAAIVAAWRASTPSGRVVLLEGEAGIGKTRLAESVAAGVSAGGGVVLAARGYPGERAIAYGPIAELLRSGLGAPGGLERVAILDDQARFEIGRLIDLPGDLRAAGSISPAPAEATGSRVRLLEAVAEALTALTSADVPGLVWVDDLHLVDDPTREALAYLARRLTGRPVCLLLAWRREDLEADAAAAVADLARLPDVTAVVLDRLDRDDVAAIVHAMRPDTVIDEARIDALAADSEGLPLHVVAAIASGDGSGTELPRSVQALLLERIGSVSETAGQILSAAAIIGRSFELSILRHASGRSEEETIDAVEELMHRGLVREVTGRAGSSVRYDFSHGRIRDVALEATSLARRRLIHRRAADALRLDPAGPDRDDLARYALIAAHEREAGRSIEAAAAFVEAADRAEALFANREAIDHLSTALALDLADGAAAHARIGELRSRLGEYPEAIAALETSAALAEPTDLPVIEVALGRVHRRRGDLAAAASHLGSVIAQPDVGDALRARALVERSLVELRAGDPVLAGQDAQDARELAERLGDPRLAGLAERLVGLGAFARGDRSQARGALQRSLDLSVDDPDPTSRIAAMTALALVLAADGELDLALVVADDAIAACRRIGDRHLEAAVENHIADMLHEAGRQDESMVHLKRAVGLFADVGDPALEPDPGIWALAAW